MNVPGNSGPHDLAPWATLIVAACRVRDRRNQSPFTNELLHNAAFRGPTLSILTVRIERWRAGPISRFPMWPCGCDPVARICYFLEMRTIVFPLLLVVIALGADALLFDGTYTQAAWRTLSQYTWEIRGPPDQPAPERPTENRPDPSYGRVTV